jgi:hypothetical protein
MAHREIFCRVMINTVMTEGLGRILQRLIIAYKSNLWNEIPELLLYVLKIRGDSDSRIILSTNIDYSLRIELSRKKSLFSSFIRVS